MKHTLFQYNGVYDEFIAGLDIPFQAAIDNRLNRLSLLGQNAGIKVTKPLRDGIFECRIQSRRQQARLLYFYLKGRKIIVANCIIKKGSKVPTTEIDRAIKIKEALEQHPELVNELSEIH